MDSPIKVARQSVGLTLGAAAKNLGIPVGYLSQIENGHRHIDSERALKIAQLYKTKVEQIFLVSRYAVREVCKENNAV